MTSPTSALLIGLDHEALLRRAIALAVAAREHGNKPFGALLADAGGNIVVEAENTEYTDRDATRHAEVNLLSKACREVGPAPLDRFVMYASTEPCAMCAGAAFFAGVRAVVFGLAGETLTPMWVTDDAPAPALLDLSCRSVFAHCPAHPTAVVGPLLEQEAMVPHAGFWK